MKRSLATLAQAALVAFGLMVAALLLWEPHLEGRNAHASLSDIYFRDPFLAYVYVASLAFFIGLYQAIRLAGYVGRDLTYTPEAVKAVKLIRTCALAMTGFAVVANVIILAHETDDRAGGMMMGNLIIAGSVAVAIGASLIGRRLQKGASQA
jgi:hypothetical protein